MIEESSCVGAGLRNLGNTCFINSVLQCLTHTSPLTEELLSVKHQDPCNCENETFCVLSALKEHIMAALTSEESFSPSVFQNNLRHFSDSFSPYAQEDAHEFLQTVWNKLEKCCGDYNFVELVFGGLLLNGLICCNCDSFSYNYEECLGLSLAVKDVKDIHSALGSFCDVEEVEGRCDGCKKNVTKKKKILLQELPQVVTFHLKKFENNGLTMVKISDRVSFPLEIDLQQYMPPPDPENKVITNYHLCSFVEHIGSSLSCGHYCSYVRSGPGIWHKFNDTEVDIIEEDMVLSKDPYILFYVREGVPWYSSWLEMVEASVQNPSPNCVLDRTSRKCASESSDESCDEGVESDVTCHENMVKGQDSSQKQKEEIFEKSGTTKNQ